MKTNFSSKLFEKKINLAEANFIFGATGGSSVTTYSGENNCDELTKYYDDNGKLTRQVSCNHCEDL